MNTPTDNEAPTAEELAAVRDANRAFLASVRETVAATLAEPEDRGRVIGLNPTKVRNPP